MPLTQPVRGVALLLVKLMLALNAPAAVGSTVMVKFWLPPGWMVALFGATMNVPLI